MAKKTQTYTGLKGAQGICNPVRKRLFTLKEGAEYLGRTVWGVRELIWSQIIPVVKQDKGRKMYLDVNDLDAFIEKNKMVYN
jgi:hypothetical protein